MGIGDLAFPVARTAARHQRWSSTPNRPGKRLAYGTNQNKPGRLCGADCRIRRGLAVPLTKLGLSPQALLELAAVAPDSSNQSAKSYDKPAPARGWGRERHPECTETPLLPQKVGRVVIVHCIVCIYWLLVATSSLWPLPTYTIHRTRKPVLSRNISNRRNHRYCRAFPTATVPNSPLSNKNGLQNVQFGR